jgi:hypothetical protein
MPGGWSSDASDSAPMLPCSMARRMSVTFGSRSGSIPLSVMNASPWDVWTSAFPRTVGAAPVTPSICCSRFTSAR